MAITRTPSYSRRRSYEMGSPAPGGLIRKALSCHSKLPKSTALSPTRWVEHRGIASCGEAHGNGNNDRMLFSNDSRGIDAIQNVVRGFVCFPTSWPVECCTCSQPFLALRSHAAAELQHGRKVGYCRQGFETAEAGADSSL